MSTPQRAPDLLPPGWLDYRNTGTRVLLRPGVIDTLGAEMAALGCRRVMVICGGNTRRSRLFDRAMAAMGPAAVTVYDRVVEHSSVELVTQGAQLARELGVDGLLAIGGGSASDSAKGIAILLGEGGKLEDHASRFEPPDRFVPKPLPAPKLPIATVVTTASAAEVTPGLGIRDPQGRKLLFWDNTLANRLIVLDPQANVEVPVRVMATTAMNGFAHCVEGLYSRLRNPISDALALHGIRLFMDALPRMVAQPDDVDARAGVLTAAHLSGMVISNARVGIHHAMCHCLGAKGGLPHGVANSVMLPHAMAYNLPVAEAELAAMAPALGVPPGPQRQMAEAAIERVRELQGLAQVPTRLRDTGLERGLLPLIAEHTMVDRGLYFNPRRTDSVQAVLDLLEGAW
ncbi:MAG TPA: iron-containing alcohol dehydrogenase [Ramlibacter sp.]|nr:iron-containing alcohol dehydrogenase [Ramlibacter sp.]